MNSDPLSILCLFEYAKTGNKTLHHILHELEDEIWLQDKDKCGVLYVCQTMSKKFPQNILNTLYLYMQASPGIRKKYLSILFKDVFNSQVEFTAPLDFILEVTIAVCTYTLPMSRYTREQFLLCWKHSLQNCPKERLTGQQVATEKDKIHVLYSSIDVHVQVQKL